MSTDEWRSFRLVPDDVLFFRDGRPSSRGDDHYLHSIFPPHPSTLYGAVRTRRLLDEDIDLAELIDSAWSAKLGSLTAELGSWGGFGSLELRGPWLVRGEKEALLRAPLDLGLVLKESQGVEAPPEIRHVLRYRWKPDRLSGSTSHLLGLPAPWEWTSSGWREWPESARSEEPVLPTEWFLKPAGLERWSAGRVPEPEDFVHASKLWTLEQRTGVGLEESSRTSRDGQLYTFGFIRLHEGVALGFEVRGTELQAGGGVRLGGEGRTARLIEGPSLPIPALPGSAGGRFRLAFFTPALSASGSWPPGFAADGGKGRLAGETYALQGAFCRGPVGVGGWDIARKASKPLRRGIPAGSVYLFKHSEPAGGPRLAAALHGTSLNDFGEEHLSRQGFGLVLAALDDQED